MGKSWSTFLKLNSSQHQTERGPWLKPVDFIWFQPCLDENEQVSSLKGSPEVWKNQYYLDRKHSQR